MKNLTSTGLLLSIAILLSACSSNDQPGLDANAVANLPKGNPTTQTSSKSVAADKTSETSTGSEKALPETETEPKSEGMSAFEKSYLENQKAQNDLQKYQAEQDANMALMDSILNAQSFGSIMAMFAPMMAKITGQNEAAKADKKKEESENDESEKDKQQPTANLRDPEAEVVVDSTVADDGAAPEGSNSEAPTPVAPEAHAKVPTDCGSAAVGNYNQAHDVWLNSVAKFYQMLRPMTTPGYQFTNTN